MPVPTMINVRVDYDGGDEHDSDLTLNAFIAGDDNVMHCYTQDQIINGTNTYTTKNIGYVTAHSTTGLLRLLPDGRVPGWRAR